jgi:hypothetical protein
MIPHKKPPEIPAVNIRKTALIFIGYLLIRLTP